jgi:hypothetical protein
MRGRVARFTVALQALLLMAMLVLPALTSAAVWTDQADYAPGSVVTISGDNSDGAGYVPAETVNVVVTGPNGYQESCSATADETGAWSCQVTLWNNSNALGDYSYTATGAESGVSQNGSFSDAWGTAIALVSSPNPSTAGQSVTFTATVTYNGNGNGSGSPVSGSAVAVGSVKFGLNGNGTCGGNFVELQGAQTVSASGVVTFITSSLAAGANSIRACYAGTGGQGTGDSTATLTQTVNSAPATVNTTTSAANASETFGAASVTLNATVTPASGAAVNTGTVTFTVNGTNVTSGTVSGGSATANFSLVDLNAGQYSIAAVYNAGAGFNGSNNAAQSPTPKLTLSPASPTCTITGYSGPYTGTAHGVSGSCVGVQGETLTGSLTGDSFTNVPGGTANWSFNPDSDNYNTKTGTASVTITAVDPTCTITGYTVPHDGLAHTATGSCVGVLGETLAGLDLSGTTHTAIGVYADSWSYTDVTGNYNDDSGSVTDKIQYLVGGSCLGSPSHQILQPVNADGTSVFRQGSTVPAKFRVCDAFGSVGTPGVVVSFRLIGVTGAASGTVNEPVDSTTPDTAFRWSSTDQQWIYNVSTKSLAKSKTYYYEVLLNDGSTINFAFTLK